MNQLQNVLDHIDTQMPEALDRLLDLLRIQSISTDSQLSLPILSIKTNALKRPTGWLTIWLQ